MREKNVISRDQARTEIEGWLEKKRVYESTIEAQKDSVDTLIDAMCRGDLLLNDKSEFVHKLVFPWDGVSEFIYKSRLNDKMLKPHLKGVKANDADGRLLAHVAALTDQQGAVIENLDSIDKKIMMSIAVFFL